MTEREANNCLGLSGGVNFEHKIVLSIAIRLRTEQFTIDKIADPAFVATIDRSQTQWLLKGFEHKSPSEDETMRTFRGCSSCDTRKYSSECIYA